LALSKTRISSACMTLAQLFPGSVLCFATLRNTLTDAEKRKISRIVQGGRASWKTGRERNPVLVLTGTELFGQFKIGKFTADYGDRSQQAERLFRSAICKNFVTSTQQVHLGMESIHVWLDKKRQSVRRGSIREECLIFPAIFLFAVEEASWQTTPKRSVWRIGRLHRKKVLRSFGRDGRGTSRQDRNRPRYPHSQTLC